MVVKCQLISINADAPAAVASAPLPSGSDIGALSLCNLIGAARSTIVIMARGPKAWTATNRWPLQWLEGRRGSGTADRSLI